MRIIKDAEGNPEFIEVAFEVLVKANYFNDAIDLRNIKTLEELKDSLLDVISEVNIRCKNKKLDSNRIIYIPVKISFDKKYECIFLAPNKRKTREKRKKRRKYN